MVNDQYIIKLERELQGKLYSLDTIINKQYTLFLESKITSLEMTSIINGLMDIKNDLYIKNKEITIQKSLINKLRKGSNLFVEYNRTLTINERI